MTLGLMSNQLSPVPWTTRLGKQGKDFVPNLQLKRGTHGCEVSWRLKDLGRKRGVWQTDGTWICQWLLNTVVWRTHLEKSQSHQPARAGGWIGPCPHQGRQGTRLVPWLLPTCLPGPDSQDARLSCGLIGEALSGH